MEKFNNMWDQMDNVSREMETKKEPKEVQEPKTEQHKSLWQVY